MKIHVPNSAFIGNIDPFLSAFDPRDESILEITTNDRWISMHPVVLCMLAALGDRAGEVRCDDITATSKHYLTRMGLYDFWKLPSPDKIKEHEAAGRFMPLKRITNSQELTDALETIVPLLHLPPKQAQTIRYIVSELVRNVLEHSSSADGAIVCAQYYAKSNKIRLGIVDSGMGIKRHIDRTHPTASHINAIRLAMVPGITGTTRKDGGTDYNAGAGLFFIKSIASINQDAFMIYSGDAMYKLLKPSTPGRLNADPKRDHHSEKENLPYWQGTCVGIDISLDSTALFTSLLEAIGDTYSEAVKERRKARYKKARFI